MATANSGFVVPTDPGELVSLVEQVRGQYQIRDRRFQDDQDLVEMRQGGTGTVPDLSQQDTVILNDGLVIWQKSAAMVASAELLISTVARSLPESGIAQKIENFLYWWREQAEDQYSAGLKAPLAFDEASMLLLRGWLCGRLMMDPDNPAFPWSYTIVDPMTIYPSLAGSRLRWVAQSYRPMVGEVLGDWGAAAETLLGDRNPIDRTAFTAIYTDTEIAVAVDGEWLKAPEQHGYGFNPMLITLAAGAPYRATETREDFQRYMGTGILHPVRPAIRNKEDYASMMRVLVGKEAEPPVALYTDDEDKFAEVDLRSGGRMVFGQKDKIELLHAGPNLQNLMPLVQMTQDEVYRGALGPATFGDTANFASGYHAATAQAGSRHMIYPYVRALERYYRTLYQNVLKLFTTQPLPSVGFVSGIGSGSGTRTWQELQPQEVMAADVVVSCTFKDVTPQDETAKAQIGFQALQAQVLDPDTVRDKYFDVKNPDEMNIKVLASLVLKNPALIQALSYAAAMQSGNPFIQQGLQATMASPQGGGQPGQPPPGVPNPLGQQPPPPGLEPPNGVLPDELGGAAGQPPNGGIPPGPMNPGGM